MQLNLIKSSILGAMFGKNHQFLVRRPYIGRQNRPFDSFWGQSFCVFKTHRYSNNRKITGKIVSCV